MSAIDAENKEIVFTISDLREREESLVEQRARYRLRTIDHGQVVTYAGDSPIETARNGVRRLGTHAKYGFGELRVVPVAASE